MTRQRRTDRPTRGARHGRGLRGHLPAADPRGKVAEYARQATLFGDVAREHGALRYREFRADDLGEGFAVGEGLLLTAAVAEFHSRAHRDEVMAKVMDDPRIKELEDQDLADMSLMRYGGFETFVGS